MFSSTIRDQPPHFHSIIPLMEKKSTVTDPAHFHHEVNIAFHNMEAAYYDVVHKDMWSGLPMQFQLLAQDAEPFTGKPISMLDIGCGTGLSTHLLLSTSISKHIKQITLVDTSSAMLKRAKKRGESWNINTDFIEGAINKVTGQYDLILVSSVLHHIPDINSFLDEVIVKLKTGGIFITIHDPLAETINNPVYIDRCNTYNIYKQQRSNKFYIKFLNGINRRFNKAHNYIKDANSLLMQKGIIHTPLSEVEMWSITDIHVEGLPYSSSPGISIKSLEQNMPGLKIINFKTYSFFGEAQSKLTGPYRDKEKALYMNNEKTGRNFGSVWVKP